MDKDTALNALELLVLIFMSWALSDGSDTFFRNFVMFSLGNFILNKKRG
jgi:hypothetical protein